ncbi:5'-3' exonuclease [Sandaracinus amylolyticus]|uniref:5'-3' exonuclease n=1 Tax=Sandaracinus amylolyticus TaxID=927083 RepID=UPI001F17D1F2|nr:5'-3' exonuclease H3TH domain-containing protein [Sandaracinus amylolyticus]UJR80377.1 DNA polymerase I 5'-3' exonuclease domain [Sandaracinus amylolyticus]
MQIHLVDGTYELFRSFFGAPSSKDAHGREVGATRGILRTLLALLEPGRADGGATHVAIAFDTVIESFRNELFAGYKTGEGIDPALWAQFPLAERAARALGIVTWSMIEFEADDALATGAARWASRPEVERVVLCSPDKDLAQCVGPKVVCLDRRRKTTMDTDGVRAKFGIEPASIPDWLALVGDTADGIPGVPRWGEKSASAVLAKFRRLEDIPDDAKTWGLSVRGADALATSLRERRADAMLYRTLATLRIDAPVAESIDDLEWRGADRTALADLCAELGDADFVSRVPRFR